MISRFFSKRLAPEKPSGSIPEGERVYAIGDIHGRLDLLDKLIAAIEADDAARGQADTRLIFLGDLIDRGPDSAQVIERVRQLAERGNCQMLLGNHEEVFVKALGGDLKALALFTRIGGRETILSYGVPEDVYTASEYSELLEQLRARVPDTHREFLAAFEDMILIGDFAFVHAGVRPTQPLRAQRVSDLRWIREDFLAHQGPLEKIVVHGHTITDDVEETGHRIGLDTGAYATGKLTAMGFEKNARWVLDTAA